MESRKDFDIIPNYSIDKSTSKNGGKLPPFGINTYDKAFEEAAFNLVNNGDISAPLLTKSGWHIIKRLGKPNPDTYDIFVRKMKAQISKDQRFDAAKLKLISDIKIASGYKEARNELNRFASGLNEDFYSYKWSPSDMISTNMLFSFGGDKIYTVKDFGEYCKKNTKTRLKYDKTQAVTDVVEELFKEYVNESAMEYEEKSLEIKYPDFRSLMREYEEGILLFEATKLNVWDKANQDTVGLKSFYEIRKDSYKWDEKAKISIVQVTSTDLKLVNKIRNYAIKNDLIKVVKKFNKKTKLIQVVDQEYEKGATELSGLDWNLNSLSDPQLNSDKIGYSFKKITELVPAKVKTLAEARGYVVADYQDYLEKEWMEQLSKEFKVVIYSDIKNKLKK
ncbi:MAG: peptidylprolyl isomerase [Saprospiraceae bacterium]|nr:peptidylprolyl isomerase [Saprospiraceae bacterium]